MNKKSAKLQLAKDASFSLTTVSTCLKVIADLTQHSNFTFNSFSSAFTFNYFTVEN